VKCGRADGVNVVHKCGPIAIGWNLGIQYESAAINNGYPYLLYFGTNTQVP